MADFPDLPHIDMDLHLPEIHWPATSSGFPNCTLSIPQLTRPPEPDKPELPTFDVLSIKFIRNLLDQIDPLVNWGLRVRNCVISIDMALIGTLRLAIFDT